MEDQEQRARRRRVRREVKWGVGAFVLVLVLEYLVLPQLGGVDRSLQQLGKVNIVYLVLGFVLESGALLAYAQLTRAVLPPDGPGRGRLLQIDLSTLALSHVVPGGTAGGAALSYRLLGQEGVRGADAGFAIAMQGVGSAVVLNVLFWAALLVSLFLRGYNPLYAVAAGAGILLMTTFAVVVVLLTRGHRKSAELLRRVAGAVPFLDADKLVDAFTRFADRLRAFAVQRQVLRRAIGWAAANWLFDAASLWVCLAAFHTIVSPIYLLVAYGLANILAVIPVTPSGLGIVEGVLVPTLVGFGVPNKSIALLAVLIYRFFNFWLPIPVGGLAYLALRFSGEGWRQRLHHLREEVRTGGDDGRASRGGAPGTGAGPDAAGPDATGPDAAGPDAAGPDAAGPDATGPDAAGPDTAGPDAAGPDAAEPGTTDRDTAAGAVPPDPATPTDDARPDPGAPSRTAGGPGRR